MKTKDQPEQLKSPAFVPVVTLTGSGTFKVELGKPMYWLTPAQFAQQFGVDRDTIYRWRETGLIEPEYIEPAGLRKWRIQSTAIAHLKEKLKNRRG